MENVPRHLAAIAFATTFALVGCAYVYRTPGAEGRPISELAVLEYEDNPAGATIAEVDGKRRGDGYFHKYELTPGEHSLKVAFNIGIAVIPIPLSFTAVAGEVYVLKPEDSTVNNTRTLRMRIVNKATGKVVAGSRN